MFFESGICRASLKNRHYGLGFWFLSVWLRFKGTEQETKKPLNPAVLGAKTPVLAAVSEQKKKKKKKKGKKKDACSL